MNRIGIAAITISACDEIVIVVVAFNNVTDLYILLWKDY
jgi:hypothetical protein